MITNLFKRFRKTILAPVMAATIITPLVLTGCDKLVSNEPAAVSQNQSMAIYSNSKEIANIPYSSISGKNLEYTTDDKIVKVDTYENLLTIFDNMGILLSEDYNYNEYGYGSKSSYDGGFAVNEAADTVAPTASSSGGGSSSTNVQVSGVDEADIIKNDGRYIYYVTYNNIKIIDTEGQSPKLVGSIDLQNMQNIYVNDIYIVDNYLVLNGGRYEYIGDDGAIIPYDMVYTSKSSMIYPVSSKSFTTFMVYDISDKSKPELVRTVETEGYAISTRLIGSTIYFVTNKWINSFVYSDANDYDILPIYRDTAVSEDITAIQPADICYFPESQDSQYMIAGAFDITSNEPLKPNAYLGSGSQIYMNQNSLYIAKINYNYANYTDDINVKSSIGSSGYTTLIYRFAIDGTSLEFKGTAEVDGYMSSQYALDEYNGFLRIATGTPSNGNGIATIDIDTMEVVGSISGLAVNESIYSVRFMGNTGYMVTYRQVDPLFVFDLSDPANPVMTGELKIPGFSQYLHPVGENYLVGFGRNTAELYYLNENRDYVGTGQVSDLGFKLSLFDISDKQNPKEVFVKKYSQNSYSDASYNPRSIMVDAANNIFAFPISQADNKFNYTYGGTVVQIDPDNGFVTLADVNPDYYTYNTRFCYIGSKLYYVADGEITVLSYPDCKLIETVKY